MNDLKTAKKKRLVKLFSTAAIFLIVIVGGWFYPLLGYFVPICMIGGIAFGRKWCDWYCPRGSFFETVISRISPNKLIPAVFKSLPMRIGMLTVFMSIITVQTIRLWPDPYRIGRVFWVLFAISSSVSIILAVIYHPRVWCCFCPVGSMAAWGGGVKGRQFVKIDSSLCNECGLCRVVCPTCISPHMYKNNGIEKIIDSSCLECGICVTACPQKALKL
jgi:polyferredoxin